MNDVQIGKILKQFEVEVTKKFKTEKPKFNYSYKKARNSSTALLNPLKLKKVVTTPV